MIGSLYTARLDEVLAAAASRAGTPGAQAALLRDGELVWSGTHGFADPDRDVPVAGQTLFCLASFGKLLLAAFTLHRVEAGLLDLDAPIGRYLDGALPGAGTVTVRMLLTHTSGYPDVYAAPEVSRILPPGDGYDPDRPVSWPMLARGIRAPDEPGARWAYSNTGYIVLAEVLVRSTGGPEQLADAWRRFALPAGAGNDMLTMHRSAGASARLARGHDRQPDGSYRDAYAAHRPTGIPADLFGLPFGDGLFAGTAIGAGRVLDALLTRQVLLTPAGVCAMTSPSPQATSADDAYDGSYGMGTLRTVVAGRSWQGHFGRYGGFTAAGGTDVDRGVTLVALANGSADESPAEAIWQALAASTTDQEERG